MTGRASVRRRRPGLRRDDPWEAFRSEPAGIRQSLSAPGRPRRRGLALLVVVAVTIGLLAISAAAVAVAMARPDPAFLALGRVDATAGTSGDVRLRLTVEDGGPNPVAGDLAVRRATSPGLVSPSPSPSRSPGQSAALWSGRITVAAGSSASVELVVPRACGIRLSVVLSAPGGERRLEILAPCTGATKP